MRHEARVHLGRNLFLAHPLPPLNLPTKKEYIYHVKAISLQNHANRVFPSLHLEHMLLIILFECAYTNLSLVTEE